MNKTKEKKYMGLRRLSSYIKKNKRLFIVIISILIMNTIIGFSIPILQANVISSLTSSLFLVSFYMAIALLAVRLIVNILNYIFNINYIKIETSIRFNIKNDLITAITGITMRKNDITNTGVYIDRINNDVNKCSDVLIDLITVFLELISNIAFLIYIAFINIYFFISLIAYVLVLWLFDSKKEKVWFKNRKKTKELQETSTSTYNEQIRGMKDIKSLNIRKNTILDSGKKFLDAINQGIFTSLNRQKYTFFRNISAIIFEVGFIIMGIFFIQYGLITLTNFLIIYMYHGNVRMLTSYIASIKAYAMEGELASRRVFEVIDEYPKEKFGNKNLENVKGQIEFKKVFFAYSEEYPILNNVNISFQPNKSTAIVGKSGSGKSTILSLSNKLYDVNSGEITIDGINIQELTEDSLRNNVGIVTQTPYVFNSSVKENLLLVKPDATEKEMIYVLKKAEIYDFFEKLPEKLDSKVGENGVMLSGGQKQRLAIARILLKNSKVIILDEATSALDNENQDKIVKVIDELKKDHTIIIVAHRLSTIIDVDKIIVINDGKIIAEGKHKVLMKNCKFYKDLYKKEENASSLKKLK